MTTSRSIGFFNALGRGRDCWTTLVCKRRDLIVDGSPAAEFSWVGFDEMDQANGRGWVVLGADGVLDGQIFVHHGDESEFRAERML